MKFAEVFSPREKHLAKLVKQCGIDRAVSLASLHPIPDVAEDEQPWSYNGLSRLKAAYEEMGFQLDVIESRPPVEKTKLGLPGRDEEIDVVCELIRNMGVLGIPVWCYEWMAGHLVLRTSKAIPSRGGALVTGYDHSLFDDGSLTEFGTVTEDQLWDNLKYFLDRVIPVAEQANVRLAMHPDDPPRSPIRGIGRIMRSVENFQRLIDLVPSPVNGIALCQGNFTLMTDDLPSVIRHFGKQEAIFYVHFRDVLGTPDKFIETFHDAGKTDMWACIKAYHEIGFEGVCRSDHVPTMEGDSNDSPMHSSIGRLFAIGYIKGLFEAASAESQIEPTEAR